MAANGQLAGFSSHIPLARFAAATRSTTGASSSWLALWHAAIVDAEPSHDIAAEGGGVWARGMASLREVLGAVFTVRRTDKPVDRLLPPEQETLVGQLLLLKLETARAALLTMKPQDFQASNDTMIKAAVAMFDGDMQPTRRPRVYQQIRVMCSFDQFQ